MSNHYHITVECTASQLVCLSKIISAKPTSIDLWKNLNHQTDRMLTKYHRDLFTLKSRADEDIERIRSMGYSVKRLKIEEVIKNIPDKYPSDCLYLEGHIKVDDNNLKEVGGFVLSKNASKGGTKFYNFRARSQEDLDVVLNNISKLPKMVSSEIEKVVYDSNQSVDRWWA